MKPSKQPYELTVAEKAIQHARKEQRKKWRAQQWKNWVPEDDDSDDDLVETDEKEEKK